MYVCVYVCTTGKAYACVCFVYVRMRRGRFVLDASAFAGEHPGGKALLTTHAGEDVTALITGGVYKHSLAAHNLAGMMRVGVVRE